MINDQKLENLYSSHTACGLPIPTKYKCKPKTVAQQVFSDIRHWPILVLEIAHCHANKKMAVPSLRTITCIGAQAFKVWLNAPVNILGQ